MRPAPAPAPGLAACEAFALCCPLLVMRGFCAQTAPAITTIARIALVSFIAIPICSCLPFLLRALFQGPLRPAPDRD